MYKYVFCFTLYECHAEHFKLFLDFECLNNLNKAHIFRSGNVTQCCCYFIFKFHTFVFTLQFFLLEMSYSHGTVMVKLLQQIDTETTKQAKISKRAS